VKDDNEVMVWSNSERVQFVGGPEPAHPQELVVEYNDSNENIRVTFQVDGELDLQPIGGYSDPIYDPTEANPYYLNLRDAIEAEDEEAIEAAALAIGDDILIAYYYLDGEEEVYLKADDDRDPFKLKYYQHYLVRTSDLVSFPDWSIQSSVIEAEQGYRTDTNPEAGPPFVAEGWLDDVKGNDLWVRVTVLNNGAVNYVEHSVAIPEDEPPGNQHFYVDPDEDRVWGHEWAEGDQIEITIHDGIAPTVYYSDNEDGDFCLDLQELYDIQVSHVVTVNDGVNEVGHTVEPLGVTEIDVDSDIISGYAHPFSWVEVEVHFDNENYHEWPFRLVQADGIGDWEADFSVEGTEGDDPRRLITYDIGPGSRGSVDRWEDDRSAATRIHWRVPNHQITESRDHNWVSIRDWQPLEDVEIVIVGGPGYDSGPIQTDMHGNLHHPLDHSVYQIYEGYEVTVTQGPVDVTHVVTGIEITDVDYDNSTVSGTAAPGSWVEVHVDRDHEEEPYHEWPRRAVQAGDIGEPDEGEWHVDFMVAGSPPEGHPFRLDGYDRIYVFEPGDRGHAGEFDSSWNSTVEHWGQWGPGPNFCVDKYHNSVDGDQWLADAIIEVSIQEEDSELGWAEVWSGGTQADQNGYFGLREIEHEIVTGNRVQVTDGITIKEHIVTELRDISVDPEANTVSGKAEADTEVYVHIHEHNAPYRLVTVEPDGTWMVSFDEAVGEDPRDQAYDIGPGTHGSADQFDDDGDQTSYWWGIPDPRFTLNPRYNDMWGNEWNPGQELFVDVYDGETPLGSAFTDQVNEWGDFFINLDDFGLDIEAGHRVVVTQGEVVRTHVIEHLRIMDVNAETNLVYGVAADNREDVTVHVWLGEGIHEHPTRIVDADGSGDWEADFTGLYDIEEDSEIHAHVHDEEGNATYAEWTGPPATRIAVNPVQNLVEGSDWFPNQVVNLSIAHDGGGYGGVVTTDSWGNFEQDLDGVCDIQAGHVVTAMQGEDDLTRSHTVTTLQVTGVDLDYNTIAGTAEPDSMVTVYLPGDPFEIQTVQASPEGIWFATFSRDIDVDSFGYAAQFDGIPGQSNHTWLRWPDDITEELPEPPEGTLLHARAGSDFTGVLYTREGSIYYNEMDDSGIWLGPEVLIGTGTTGRLTIDSLDNPHVVYITPAPSTYNAIGYRKLDGDEWSAEVLIESNGSASCSKPDIAVDSSGYAHVTYTDPRGNPDASYNDIMYAVNTSGSFLKTVYREGVGSSPFGWYYDGGSLITVDGSGNRYIFYLFRFWESGWGSTYYLQIEGTEICSGGENDSNRLQYDFITRDGKLYALYRHGSSTYVEELTVSGGTITGRTVVSTVGIWPAYSHDVSSGNVVIGSKDGSNLRYHYNNDPITDGSITVKGDAVSVVYVGGDFYAFYTDNDDDTIKWVLLEAPPQ